MLLPNKIIPYLQAILSASLDFNLVYLSHFTKRSHDSLNRLLQQKYSWKLILKQFLFRHCLNNGYLIIDETDIDKSYAKVIEGLGWIFSHRKNKHIFGYHLVVIVWTNEKLTIPITWKLYQKDTGKTKQDLALEMIKYCMFTLGIKPHAWLFDSLYASEKILSFLDSRRHSFFTQVPKNRKFNHQQLKFHNNNRPYWMDIGTIKGKIQVQLVKNRKKYFITNVISISRKKQLDTYKIRWKIEEVFRFVKSQLGFEKCQCRSIQSQVNHWGLCFSLYVILQDIAQKTELTVYQIKRQASFDHQFALNLDLSKYLDGA